MLSCENECNLHRREEKRKRSRERQMGGDRASDCLSIEFITQTGTTLGEIGAKISNDIGNSGVKQNHLRHTRTLESPLLRDWDCLCHSPDITAGICCSPESDSFW